MITSLTELPPPECEGGYPLAQLCEVMDIQQLARLNLWMAGQTMMLCEGAHFNHETGERYPCCGGVAHGPVVYVHDLARFLRAGKIID